MAATKLAEGEELGSNLLRVTQSSLGDSGGLGRFSEKGRRRCRLRSLKGPRPIPGLGGCTGPKAFLARRPADSNPNERTTIIRRPRQTRPPWRAYVSGSRARGSPMMAASSKTFRLRSSTLPARSKSCRSANDRTAFSTWSECWTNITRCRPQGAYRPKIQFLTVRSFAPVQPATNFAREFRSFSSDFNASAIFIANA